MTLQVNPEFFKNPIQSQMKPSAIRLKVIAGAVGVLTLSQPVRLSAQGTPLGQEGTPLGKEGTPLGREGKPLGQEGTPLGKEGTPLGKEGTPLAKEGTSLAQEGTPIAETAVPLAKEGRPLSEDGTPAGKEGTPIAESGVPLVQEGTPLATYGTPADNARQQRLQNRSAAMSDPGTSRFFGGNTETRRSNASKNFGTAISSQPPLDDDSVARQNAVDREWSRGAIDSANARPQDLFSSDWWSAHPDVLTDANKYYTSKPAYAWWQGSPWSDLIRVLGMRNSVQPYRYSNDRNITFRNDLIYVNGQAVSSYDDFVNSAQALVESTGGDDGKRQGWFPLGTFAASADPKTQTATHAIQLAMDSVGNIAGVCVSWPDGKVLPIRGKVDTDSQRVAFNIGDRGNAVVETGLANLTNPYTRVWAHLPNSHSQTWLITRLREGE